jgi:hypothetical protein
MPVKRCISLIFVFLAVFPLPAATVSFLVVETGLDTDVGSNQHSGLWESGLLDVFFESGHIVTNAPVMRLDRLPSEAFPPEAQNDLNDAREGGMDYFVIALLEYPVSGPSANEQPRRITLRLFSMRPFEMVYEHKYNNTNSRSTKEEYDNLKIVIRTLLPKVR